MWDVLLKLYERDDTEQRCQLLEEFFNAKYQKGTSIMSHVSTLENLYTRLNAIKGNVSEQMLITKIITTLPSHYSYFSAAWEATATESKTLVTLKSRLMAEENRHKSQKAEPEGLAFRAQVQRCYNCNRVGHRLKECRDKIVCNLCNKPNHVAKFCRNKNGSARDKTDNKNKGSHPPCGICKKTNHLKAQCFFRDKNESDEKNKRNKNGKPVLMANNLYDGDVKTWVIDSGATSHICRSREYFTEFVKCNHKIGVAKEGEFLIARGIGVIHFDRFILRDVYYIPEASRNLISISVITQQDGQVFFDKNEVTIKKDGKFVFKGTQDESGLFIANAEVCEPSEIKDEDMKGNAFLTSPALDWHAKMGHLGKNNMLKLVKMAEGINLTEKDILSMCDKDNCDVCLRAKLTRTRFGKERERAKRKLEIIHTDLCGPIEPDTWDNKRYIATFTDGFSGFLMVSLLTYKSELFENLRDYVTQAETKFNLKVSKIRCDRGGEYMSADLKDWCREKGIILDYSPPATPQLNSTAERTNRVLLERARALIFEGNVDKKLWGEAVYTATHLLNRSPKSWLNCTPYEKWYDKTPNLKYLQIFGSMAYAKNLKHLKKLDERCQKYTLVGYASNAYRLWDAKDEKIIVSRDVAFIKPSNNKLLDAENVCDPFEDLFKREESESEKSDENLSENEVEMHQDETEEEIHQNNANETEGEPLQNIQNETEEENLQKEQNEVATRAGRVTKQTQFYGDPVPSSCILLTFSDAVTGPDGHKWKTAIDDEINSLAENEVYKLVDEKEAKGAKVLSNRWVFRIKDNGQYKARLCVRGNEQKEDDFDYEEIFSPVTNESSIKIMFALALQYNYKILKFDVKCAFLYGNLEENVFMKIPEGYTKYKNKIFKLLKALYGLKQSPLQWFKRLTDFLAKCGLKQLKSDRCVFRNTKGTLWLAIHVDDGLVVYKNVDEKNHLVKAMQREFKLTLEENPTCYLNIKIEAKGDTLKLSQEAYANSIINSFNMSDCKPVSTPMEPGQMIERTGNSADDFPYRQAVGSLLYLSNKTRPDISFAVSYASRHMEKPEKNDIDIIKRILRYLRGTTGDGVMFERSTESELTLSAFCDASYADDLITRRSTSGYMVLLNDNPVSWASRRQPIVATSTTESEYIALADTLKNLLFLKSFIEELTDKQVRCILKEDNQGTIRVVKKGQFNRRSKHIDVRYHYVHEKFSEGFFKIQYCPSSEQLADMLTKPLPKLKFTSLRDRVVK